MKRILVAAVGMAFVFGASVMAQDAKKIDEGKKLYEAQKCVTCHQIAGKGNKMFPLDGVGSKLSAADLKMWLTAPDEMAAKLAKKPPMKMKKYDLKDTELDALVAYMLSLKK
jgi:mono/diheme cytochrome c family protein